MGADQESGEEIPGEENMGGGGHASGLGFSCKGMCLWGRGREAGWGREGTGGGAGGQGTMNQVMLCYVYSRHKDEGRKGFREDKRRKG